MNLSKRREAILSLLKALVIAPNEKTAEFGCLLAVARAEARKREQSKENPPVRVIQFVSELGVYVAVYEAFEKSHLEAKNAR
jgi:hypothetical protein